MSGSGRLRLSQLTIYPIKSARGISLDQWEVDDFGLRLDRRWMVVDQRGEFISQRSEPRMALVVPSIVDGRLKVEAPGMPPLELKPNPPATVRAEVTVWEGHCQATWLGEGPAGWFSRYLDSPVSLVYMDEETVRPANPLYAPEDTRVSFTDGYPFLLISEASLVDLNRRLDLPLPMNRFRPNLVVSGGEPYQEDHWREIQIGEIPMQVVKPCARCVITTTDQATGERAKEPLRTLATYRKVNGGVMFGQNVVHRGRGRLQVGDYLSLNKS